MSLRLWGLSLWLRLVEKRRLRTAGPMALRARLEDQARWLCDPPFALYLTDEVGGVSVTWASAQPFQPGVLLWIHGGAHVAGSARTHRALAARIGAAVGLRAVLPDYGLAPEHLFPRALRDCLAVWDGLIARGYPAESIVLGGDSAGGGVTLALLATLLARGARPAAVVALSPLTDLTGSGASLQENAAADVLLPATRFAEVRRLYLGPADPADWRASPLFAVYPDCPPVFLQVGESEILRDDSLRLAARLTEAGVPVTLDRLGDVPHVLALFQGRVPEADAAVARIGAFLRRTLVPRSPAGN